MALEQLDTDCGPVEGKKPRARPSVWIVEDSPLHGEVARQALAPHYDVSLFVGGPSMLEELACGESPDALVLDWYMPEMSGAEVCAFIRGTLNLAQLPILVLTAVGTSDDLLDALSTGANDFVKKPLSEPELVARIKGLVRMSNLHASLAEAERKLRIEAVFRERFMGMLAHDLRQPLNTVILACEMLSQLQPSEQSAAVIGRQLRAAERMKRMVTDLLDFTRNRPESGVPLQRTWTDFADVAERSLSELRSAHPDHVLQLSVEGACTGHWDADRLAQILSNLIGNAVQHGEANTQVDVRLTGKSEAVELRVTNQGPGISEEILATLFQPFRPGRNIARSSGGLALGLYIVHQIVRAHGGTIAVESRDGATHFIAILPREGGQKTSDSAPPSR